MQCSENAMLSRGRRRRLLCLHCKQFHISGVESSPFTPISDRQGGQQLYWVILYIKKASSAYIQSLTTTESIITTSMCCSRNKPSGNCTNSMMCREKSLPVLYPFLTTITQDRGTRNHSRLHKFSSLSPPTLQWRLQDLVTLPPYRILDLKSFLSFLMHEQVILSKTFCTFYLSLFLIYCAYQHHEKVGYLNYRYYPEKIF